MLNNYKLNNLSLEIKMGCMSIRVSFKYGMYPKVIFWTNINSLLLAQERIAVSRQISTFGSHLEFAILNYDQTVVMGTWVK